MPEGAPSAGWRALRSWQGIPSLVLVLAALAAFASGIDGVFVFDDLLNIVHNNRLHQLWPTADLWEQPGGGLSGRPVVAFSLALNWAVSGEETWSYHLVNLAIHALSTVCAYALVRRLCEAPHSPASIRARARPLAFAIALVWSVHPLHCGSVTYIVQRCESLMGFFFLAGLVAALWSFDSTRPRLLGLLALCAMILGGLVKESMAVLPLVVLALDAAFVSGSWRTALRSHGARYVWFVLPWLVIAAVVLTHSLHRAQGGEMVPEITAWSYLKTQAHAILLYLRLACLPVDLAFDYGWPLPARVVDWLPQGCFVLALVGATFVTLERWPRVGAVALCFFILLAPTSSFVPIPFELVAEHRMYLPLLALVGLAVAGLDRAIRPELSPVRARWAGLGLVLVVAALFLRTTLRNRDFSSTERVWQSTVESRPDNDRAWQSLADVLRREGRLEEALAAYDRAQALRPDFTPWVNNRATFLMELGRLDQARTAFERSLSRRPNAILVRANLARVLARQGELPRALALLEEGLALEPDSAELLEVSGAYCARAGQHALAVERSLRALKLEPVRFDAFELVCLLWSTSSRVEVFAPQTALAQLAGANSNDPGRRARLKRLRGLALAASGRVDEGIAALGRALEALRSDGPSGLSTKIAQELEQLRAGALPRDVLP